MADLARYDAAELLNEMKRKLCDWRTLSQAKVSSQQAALYNNCRVVIAACIQSLEDELADYDRRVQERPAAIDRPADRSGK